ncbi:tetratricopeptide repeat protein [Sulfurovum sp. NBC37-1]|uniref:tetratricopeptide repeat protein n=1 Tax=Sulfurovum sp. (strain NBC37-1) TaxID=387093 RepID=UPI00015876C8|nr:tetratricopeptide repeat protein [Sulfurovum sp. NBC37-1]BAF71571.1 conserved hypothetical protein [Sulfurovum sp. NBC37-1]
MKNIFFIIAILIGGREASASGLKNIIKCSKGDSHACIQVGQLFEYGEGVKQNLAKAKQYYKKSCQLQLGKGCWNLAHILIKEHNIQAALEYDREGCKLNYSNACSDLGFLYEKGESIEPNYSQAKKYYQKACNFGNKSSCKKYTYLDKNGIT